MRIQTNLENSTKIVDKMNIDNIIDINVAIEARKQTRKTAKKKQTMLMQKLSMKNRRMNFEMLYILIHHSIKLE